MEGLADTDHVQARLVGQLLHQRGDLLDRLAIEALLAHSPINWSKGDGDNRSEAGVRRAAADDTTLMAENKAELKSLLMKVKEESEKLA